MRDLLAERLRRDQLRDRIHAAIADRFEIVRVPSWSRSGGGAAHVANVPRVRRTLVYEATAAALDVAKVTTPWCQTVHAVACSLGAVPACTHNRRMYLGVRPRWKNPRPIAKLSRLELERVQREWRAELAKDGFDDLEAPQGGMRRLPDYDSTRAEVNDGYLRRAREFYWRDLRIWHEHAINGLPIREIMEVLGLGKWVVEDAISRLRAAMPKVAAGHPGQGEETSADAEEESDPDPDRE